jgi:hypothetical protein
MAFLYRVSGQAVLSLSADDECLVSVTERNNPSTYLNNAYLLDQKAPKSRVSGVCVVELVRGYECRYSGDVALPCIRRRAV